MLDGAIIIPLQSLFWNLLFELGALLWVVDRALLNVGYFLMVLTGWLAQNVFVPLLGVIGDQTSVLIGPVFTLAMTLLGFTYLLAVFGRFEVVRFRSAVLWLLFASTLYTFGPTFYTGMEEFRRLMGGGFYEAGVSAFNGSSAVAGLNAIGTLPSDAIPMPTDQFGAFLGGIPGASAVDGLDVALAYLSADGYDALASSGSPHPIARLPFRMVQAGLDGFFDSDTGPDSFYSMADSDRQASIGRAIQGVWRLFTALFIVLFGIIEQLVNLLMAMSFALAFFSMFIATAFGFFVRTEPIAWGALNLIIELFIQSLLNAFLMSLILGFVLVGANTANAILLLGVALVGLWMAWNLLHGCMKGLVNASERLYLSFSASTGGHFATVSETNHSAGNALSSLTTGASVLAGGGTFLQALGGTFGDSRTAQTMNYASRLLGGEDTRLGSMAHALGEGASARSLAGPVGGYLLGQQTHSTQQAEQERTLRRAYVGESDRQRTASIQQYRQSSDPRDLEQAFTRPEIQQVQALTDLLSPADFDTLSDSVREVRNDSPGLSPHSPAFMERVRHALPSPLSALEAPALESFAQLFGSHPDVTPSAYAQALHPYQAPTLGAADRDRDLAVQHYRSGQQNALDDSFSPDEVQRLAQLIDAYDDDDFAQVVYAVRSARETLPDSPSNSPSVLQATRRALPDSLKTLPHRDLSTFSRSFGVSPQRPTQPDTHPTPWVGQADHDRDNAILAYRHSHDETALRQAFSEKVLPEMTQLVSVYPPDTFQTVVKAVRQARTLDPEQEAGSPQAVRQARKQLPAHLKTLPSADLTAFSRSFGADPDRALHRRASPTPTRIPLSAQESAWLADQISALDSPKRQNRALPRPVPLATERKSPLLTAVEESPQPQLNDLPPPLANSSVGAWFELPDVPPVFATPQEHALQLDSPTLLTPLVGLKGMRDVHRTRLGDSGLGSMEVLASTPIPHIASVAEVPLERASAWREVAQTVLTAQEALKQRRRDTLQPMKGLGQARLNRLATQGIVTPAQLARADTAQVATHLRVSEAQVIAWQQEAQSHLSAEKPPQHAPENAFTPPPLSEDFYATQPPPDEAQTDSSPFGGSWTPITN